MKRLLTMIIPDKTVQLLSFAKGKPAVMLGRKASDPEHPVLDSGVAERNG
jgi:hypothetical protein